MNEEPLALLPELLLLLGSVGTLLLGAFSSRGYQWRCRVTAVAALVASAVATVALAFGTDQHLVFDRTFAVDRTTTVVRLLVCLATLLVIGLGTDQVAGDRREAEAYVLLLLGSLGALIMGGTTDLIVLGVGFLLTSVPSYALVGWGRTALGTEAALKYYLLGALSGAVMLLGTVVLYGVGGATAYGELRVGLEQAPRAAVAFGLVAVLAGLLFKAGAVPAHFWVPDVTEGSQPLVGAFLTTVPKVGALVAVLRLLVDGVPVEVVDWPLLLAVIAAVTVVLGTFAALRQDQVLRLLGWSTVSQVGFLLFALAAAGSEPDRARRALLFYLVAYAVTNLAAFALVSSQPEAMTLSHWATAPRGVVVLLGVVLLGLTGIPPTGVFVGKLLLLGLVIDVGFGWLAAIGAAMTVLSLVVYLRWLLPAVQGRPGPAAPPRRGAILTGALSSPWVIGTGLIAGPLLVVMAGPLLS